MGKFKVGDHVELLCDIYIDGIKAGDKFIVIKVSQRKDVNFVRINIPDGIHKGFFESRFKLDIKYERKQKLESIYEKV